MSRHERNCGAWEEPPQSTYHPDKYSLRQYLADQPDPELGCIQHFARGHHRSFKTSESMNPKSIVFSAHRNGWMARATTDDLVARLGEEAIAYSTITKCYPEARTDPADAMPASDVTSRHPDESDEAIMSALKNSHSRLFDSSP
jgi:hypothetical protein